MMHVKKFKSQIDISAYLASFGISLNFLHKEHVPTAHIRSLPSQREV